MTPSIYTVKLSKRNPVIRKAKTARANLPATNVGRKQSRVDRKSLRKKRETAEGMQHKSSCGLEPDSENTHLKLIPENYAIVYFDLETSGFGHFVDILQIAAKSGSFSFCLYINPTQEIDPRASGVTGLENVNGELYLRGKKVISIPIKDALVAFHEFLKLLEKPCLLVAHNASCDAKYLVQAVNGISMIDDFQPVVVGFSDTLHLLKKMYPGRKGRGMFKLEKLAEDILNVGSNPNFHDALYDVEILENLSNAAIDIDSLFTTCERFSETLNKCMHIKKVAMALPYLKPLKNVISKQILKKIAGADITYDKLREVQKTSGTEGVVNLLSERMINNKPRVTSNKKILLAITDFLAKNTN